MNSELELHALMVTNSNRFVQRCIQQNCSCGFDNHLDEGSAKRLLQHRPHVPRISDKELLQNGSRPLWLKLETTIPLYHVRQAANPRPPPRAILEKNRTCSCQRSHISTMAPQKWSWPKRIDEFASGPYAECLGATHSTGAELTWSQLSKI